MVWPWRAVKGAKAENWIASFTVVLAIANAFLAFSVYRQVSIMENDQRPWVGMDYIKISGDRVTGVYYALGITNAGKSPALNVNVSIGDWNQDAKSVRLFTKKCSGDCREHDIEMIPGYQLGIRIPIVGKPFPKIGDTAWLIARIDYRDSESRWHKTGICFTCVTTLEADQKTIVTDQDACAIPNSNYAD